MAGSHPSPAPPHATPASHHLYAAFAGLFIGLGLWKFGTPVVLAHKVARPVDIYELYYQVWPVDWAYVFLGLFALASLAFFRWRKPQPLWPVALVAVWYAWQLISAAWTVDSELTVATLKHFTGAVVCFGIGYFALSNIKDLRLMWFLVLVGFIVVLRLGLDQHFGGFERARQYFYTYILPNLPEPPLDYIQKISSNRIYGPLFYPNSFAGAILLFLPMSAFAAWEITRRFGRLPQITAVSIILLASLACLYWSGSKSGWLIFLGMTLGFLLHTPIPKRVKIGLIAAVFLIGASAFTLKYLGFFQKGATSVAARLDYWKAAVTIFRENPVLGSGPGTFSVRYAEIKSPESEMARLCHNDYLEQACDSGLIGFLTFLTYIGGSLLVLYRYRIHKGINLHFLVWLGLVGICVQGVSEFNFYLPGLAWPVFLLIGWLWAATNQVDNGRPANYAPKK